MRIGSSGQSLVQVLVAVAIGAVVLMTFATMITNLQRQVSQANQKLASLDIQRVVTTALADTSGTGSGVCSIALGLLTQPQSFDPTTVGSGNSPTYPLPLIPSTGVAGAPPAVSAGTLSPASPLSPSLYVSSINLTNFHCPGTCSATTTTFSANIVVSFSPNTLVLALAPLSFPVTVQTAPSATTPGQVVPVSCSTPGGSRTPAQTAQGTGCLAKSFGVNVGSPNNPNNINWPDSIICTQTGTYSSTGGQYMYTMSKSTMSSGRFGVSPTSQVGYTGFPIVGTNTLTPGDLAYTPVLQTVSYDGLSGAFAGASGSTMTTVGAPSVTGTCATNISNVINSTSPPLAVFGCN